MAKKTAHLDALGSYEAFRAPWETEGGQDAEIDKGKLKRLIFNLKQDFAKSRDTADERQEALTEAEAQLETAKAEAADANGEEAQKKIDKLEKKVADLTAERDKFVADKELDELRSEVLGDFAEKNPKAAKYVKGATKEELEKSLAEVKDDWGIADEEPGDGNDDDSDDDGRPVRNSPQTRVKLGNSADRGGRGGEVEIDFDKVAEEAIFGKGPFG